MPHRFGKNALERNDSGERWRAKITGEQWVTGEKNRKNKSQDQRLFPAVQVEAASFRVFFSREHVPWIRRGAALADEMAKWTDEEISQCWASTQGVIRALPGVPRATLCRREDIRWNDPPVEG